MAGLLVCFHAQERDPLNPGGFGNTIEARICRLVAQQLTIDSPRGFGFVRASEKSPGVLDQLPQPGVVIIPVVMGGAGLPVVAGLAGGCGRLGVWSGARRW